MDKTVHVTRFKADSAHLNDAQIGIDNTVLVRPIDKPGVVIAKKIMTKVNLNKGDVTPTNMVCNKIGGYIGQAADIMGGVNTDINSLKKMSANEISSAKKMAGILQGGGMKGCPTPKIMTPKSLIDNAASGIKSAARDIQSIKIRPDDLLLGASARALLVKTLNSICGTKLNDPTAGLLKAFKDLLGVLDNLDLFSNSDLLAAIAKCSALTKDHSKVLNHKTSRLAKDGNAKATKDIVTNIPDTNVSTSDTKTLAKNMTDTKSNSSDLMTTMNTTGVPSNNLTSSVATTTTPTNVSGMGCLVPA